MKTTAKKIWGVIPVYNNGKTVSDVVTRCMRHLEHILVVDDGSTDLPSDFADSLRREGVEYVRHTRNRGKGAALLTALEYLVGKDADYMITIDADGQHYPEDIPTFLTLLKAEDNLIVVGCRDFSGEHVPRGSKIGRRLANFCFRLETGQSCHDCQSGFRAYPVQPLAKIRFLCRHYNFETEVLTRAVWGGLTLRQLPVRAWYPEPEQRVSHFRNWRDNFRITLIHTHLLGLRLLPFRARRLVTGSTTNEVSLFRHPIQFIRQLLFTNGTPSGLGTAAAVGTFLAVLPLPGLHSLAIAYTAAKLRLNLIMALAIQNLFMPPLTPFLCIELGYFLLHGQFLTELTFDTLVWEAPKRLLEWGLGSLLLAPILAVLTGMAVWGTATFVARRRSRQATATMNLSATRGKHGGIWFFRTFIRYFGVQHACNFVWGVALFYVLFDVKARRAAWPYLQLRFPKASTLRRWLEAYRLFVNQGQTLLLTMSPDYLRNDDGSWKVLPQKIMKCRSGAIALCSHFGAWQLSMRKLPQLGRPIAILEQPDRNMHLDKGNNVTAPDMPFRRIRADDFMGGLWDSLQVLEQGDVLCVMGDRVGNGQTVLCDFLGKPMAFPASPWWLAARSQCPVFPVFAVADIKQQQLHYFFGEQLEVKSDPDRPVRAEDYQAAAQRYVDKLAEMVTAYPHQFFYFEQRNSGRR